MGSMIEVMRRLRTQVADAPPAPEPQVRLAEEVVVAAPPPLDSAPLDAAVAAAVGTAEPAASVIEKIRSAVAVIQSQAQASASVEPPVGVAPPAGTTVDWDAARVDPAVVAFHDLGASVCEQYRAVRARLRAMNPSNLHQVIALTSSIPQEGKSVSTVNLAMVMAEGGEHQVLIADADFRRSSIARMLGIPEKPGLAELLRHEAELADVIQASPFPNLKVMPAGSTPARGYGELLGSPGTRSLLERLRESFDYTFVDTPPVTTVSDVSMLAPLCDGALLVIQMRRTPEPTVQSAARTLQANNVRILGTILSRFAERSAPYYDRYYGYYRND